MRPIPGLTNANEHSQPSKVVAHAFLPSVAPDCENSLTGAGSHTSSFLLPEAKKGGFRWWTAAFPTSTGARQCRWLKLEETDWCILALLTILRVDTMKSPRDAAVWDKYFSDSLQPHKTELRS